VRSARVLGEVLLELGPPGLLDVAASARRAVEGPVTSTTATASIRVRPTVVYAAAQDSEQRKELHRAAEHERNRHDFSHDVEYDCCMQGHGIR
jgi:hypothetical protein